MAQARGIVTVTDITDGLPTISIIQTNENHTYSASSTGVVPTNLLGTTGTYQNDIIVLIGSDQANYVTSTPTANNTFTLGTPTVNPVGDITPTVASISATQIDGSGSVNNARVRINAYLDSASDVTINYPVIVRRLNQNVTLNIQLSFSKAEGGAGQSVTLTADRQTFSFANTTATLSTDSEITLTAVSDGVSSGNFTWMQSVDGATEVAVPPGQITGTNNNTVTVSAAQFGNRNTITYRAMRGTASDRVSIVRINNGNAAIYIVARVTAGSLQLKNNSGSVTVVADVYRDNTEVTNYASWTFTWTDGSTTLSSATSGITISDFGGATGRQIVIDAAYVPNNGSSTINIAGTES